MYLTLVGVPSALVEGRLVTLGGSIEQHVGWVVLLMWLPALASVVTRLVLHEGFTDISLRWGGVRGFKGAAIGIAYPLLVGALAYGAAWSAGLAGFAPPAVHLPGLAHAAAPARFSGLLGIAATLGVAFSLLTAAGEEIGWRGYMLTRLVDAGVPRPVLVSGLIWAAWHLPLIVSGKYAAGPYPLLSAGLFVIDVVAAAYVLARLRLDSGSVWAACIGHAAWNSIIQGAFDASSRQPGIWVGESGVLTALAAVLITAVLLRRPFAFRRHTREQEPALVTAARL